MKKYLIVLMLFTVACTAHGQLTTTTVVTTSTLNRDWFTYIILDTNLDGNGLILNESIESLLGTGLTFDTLTDADGDTMVQVEESADEDVIRFDAAGTGNIMTLTSSQAMLYLPITVSGATVLQSTLGVTNATILGSTLLTQGLATMSASLVVRGTAEIGTDNFALTISGDGYLVDENDAVTVNDDFDVTGATALQSTLTVTSATILSHTLAVTGASVFSDTVGIGIAPPDDLLHVYGGSAGTVAAESNTRVVIEDDGQAYLSFLTPNTASSGFYFGDPENNAIGSIAYNHSTNELGFATGGTSAMTIESNQYIGMPHINPPAQLTVGSAGGATMASIDGANDLFVTDDAEIEDDLYVGDDLFTSGIITALNDIIVREDDDDYDAVKLYATTGSGSITTYIGGQNQHKILSEGTTTFNELGTDVDFRIEGVGAANALFVQGSDGFVGRGIGAPISPFHLYEDTAATGTTVGLTVEQDNASGDALLQFLLTGGQRYVMGIDTSDAARFKISPTTDLSSGPFWGMNSTGLILSHSVGDNLGQYQLTSDRDGDEEDLYELGFWGISDGPDSAQYAAIRGYIVDNANTSEDGGISLWTSVDGTATETLTVRRDKVGVNALVPIANLHVEADAITVVSAFFGDDTAAQADSAFFMGNSLNGAYGMDSDSSSLWINYNGYQGGATKFRDLTIGNGKNTAIAFIDGSSGHFGIGLGGTAAYRLDAFVSTEDYIAKLFNDGGATTNKGLLIQMGEDTSSGQSIPLDIADGNGTLEGGIELNNGVVAIYNVSDQRLKDDITTTVLVASDVLNALKVRDFTWKGGSVRSTGFVAQEVAAVYPVMAGERTYTRQLETGTTQTLTSDTGTTYTTWVWDKETTTVATVTQSRLLPVLVKGFQEQDKVVVGQGLEIIRQQQTIDMLTGEVAELWAENMEMNARLERLEALLLNR